MLQDPALHMVILDELNIVLRKDYLPLDEVLAGLRARRPDLHVVVTGRNAKPDADRGRRPGHRNDDDQAPVPRRRESATRRGVLSGALQPAIHAGLARKSALWYCEFEQ